MRNSSIEKISFLHASMLIISAVGVFNHVTIIPILLQASERDAWVATLFAGFVLLCCTPLLMFVIRRTQKHREESLPRLQTAATANQIQ